MMNTEELKLVSEWDKTFPKSEQVAHKKITFINRYGITLAADLYMPRDVKEKLPALAVAGPFGAVKEQCSGLYAQTMAEKGYLTISAKKTEKEEEGKGKDKFIRRERKVQCSRSYYVGEGVTENDIKAKYDNGVLCINVPKDKPKQIEAKKIEIE